MGRPRYYWYGTVKKMINKYPILVNEKTTQAGIFRNAVEKSIEETKQLPDGEMRVKAVQVVLIKQSKTVEGAAMDLNYSWRTVQNWITSFVNLTGRNAGF